MADLLNGLRAKLLNSHYFQHGFFSLVMSTFKKANLVGLAKRFTLSLVRILFS